MLKKTTPVKQLALHVRSDFDVPMGLQRASLEETEEILTLGAAVQQMTRTRRSTAEIRAVTEQKDAELARIQAQYQEKLATLAEELRAAGAEKDRVTVEMGERLKEAQLFERGLVSVEYEEKIRGLRRENETWAAKYSALEAARGVLEEARDRDIQAAVGRTEDMMSRVIAAKEAELDRMRGAYDKMNEAIRRQTEELGKLTTSVAKRGANVRAKGADYEEEFGAKLRRHFGIGRGFTLTDTRLQGVGHAMDYSMTIEGHVVMWELKNYSATVPKAEVDKFLRDAAENAHCTVVVMVSRSTDIHGKAAAGPMQTEFDGATLFVYLSRFEEFCGDDEGRVFQMLLALFRIWWEYHREENTQMDRAELVRELEKAVEEVARRRVEWRRHRANLDEVGRWMTDVLEESETRLDRLLSRVKAAAEEEAEMAALEPPPEVFRETTDEKELQWIASILRVCEVGGEMEVRELVERLAAHHRLSRDTIRSNVMAVLRDDAVFKRSVVKYVRGLRVPISSV